MKLRDYQETLAEQGATIIRIRRMVYYAIEMRVGKTLIALHTAELVGARRVLFLTKKKAIESVRKDYHKGKFPFDLEVTNYEQAAKHERDKPYDIIILDEAHALGAYPKPTQRTTAVKKIAQHAGGIIYLSGTPTPESLSQMFHQMWVSPYTPFAEKNFYQWARTYVDVKDKRIGAQTIKDYKHARADKVLAVTKPFTIDFTQKEAGFMAPTIEEHIIQVSMTDMTRKLIRDIKKQRIITLGAGWINEPDKYEDGMIGTIMVGNATATWNRAPEITADTAVKLQSKVHQLGSGTVIDDDNKQHVLDMSKADTIHELFSDRRIAIFYKYQAEHTMLRMKFPKAIESAEQFNATTGAAVYISQIQSGSQGVDLSTADALVFLNIDFSATQYWQARARMQHLNRETPSKIYWLVSDVGIEREVLQAVRNKQDYTTIHFKRGLINEARDERTSGYSNMAEIQTVLFS